MDEQKNNRENWVAARLEALSPEGSPPVKAARAELETRLTEKEQNMWQKMLARKYRPAWATLAVVAVLAFSLSIPQVRVAATSFLGLFRVEQIEAGEVGISLDNLPAGMEDNFVALDNLLADQVFVEDVAEPVEVGNLDEAAALAGFAPRIPAELAGKAQRIAVQSEASIRLVIDQPRWQALIDSMGYDFEIPKSADGAEVKVRVPNAIVTGFGDCQVNAANEVAPEAAAGAMRSDCTILMQSEAPEIEAPPGLDINQAGAILLQVLGMTPEEAAAFSERVDWSTTLVVPVPQGADYQNVTVDGVDGVLLIDSYGAQNGFTLLWVKDGMFYALTGYGNRYVALGIANSME